MKVILNIQRRLFKDSDNPYLAALKNPSMYFEKLAKSTLIIGAITFVINWAYINSSLHTVKVPNGLHALVGFVIALLLVFRTNTAYDRWWEGRKKMQDLNGAVSFFVAYVKAMGIDGLDRKSIFIPVNLMLEKTRIYLKADRRGDNTSSFHQFQMDKVSEIIKDFYDMNRKGKLMDPEFHHFRTLTKDMLDAIISMERIKNTPIPFAYAIHIKLSIFIYVVTLPFSMLYDMNMWSTVIVMALYFLIAGIEIISSEIENPFSGEPNDLPVDNLIDGIKKHIK